MTEKVDTLIIPGWLIPVVPENQVLQNHAIALRDGVISHLLPTAEATSLDAAETLH